jgi:DNA repair protein RecO (recombination protein O)
MLKKTNGIVLSTLKFKETSIIARIFTRELGLKSYIINGVRATNKNSKMAFYQPLTLLDLVVYDKANSNLNRISEVRLLRANQLISFDFSRTGIALFVTEVITKSIFENYQNEQLFDFLDDCIVELDHPNVKLDQYPLVFLLENAVFLGFAPDQAAGYLDESRSQPFSPSELIAAKAYLESLMNESFRCDRKVNLALRRKLLDHLLDFYNQHLENPGVWKSMSILRQVLA